MDEYQLAEQLRQSVSNANTDLHELRDLVFTAEETRFTSAELRWTIADSLIKHALRLRGIREYEDMVYSAIRRASSVFVWKECGGEK